VVLIAEVYCTWVDGSLCSVILVIGFCGFEPKPVKFLLASMTFTSVSSGKEAS